MFRRHAIKVDVLETDKRKLEEEVEMSRKRIKNLEEELNQCQQELAIAKMIVKDTAVATQVPTTVLNDNNVQRATAPRTVSIKNAISKSSDALYKRFLNKRAMKREVFDVVRNLDFDKCSNESVRYGKL